MKKLSQIFTKYSEIFVAFLLFLLFSIFLIQIFMRYVLSRPPSWTIEACIIAYVWIIFWGSSFILKFEDQVKFSILYDSVSEKTQKIFTLIAYTIITLIFIYATPTIIDYILFMSLERSDALHIRKDFLYAIFGIFTIMVPLKGFVIIYQNLPLKKQGDK